MNISNFNCRSCSGHSAKTLLDMGEIPLANAFVTSEHVSADGFRAPLKLVICDNCRLIQLRELVDRESLFSDYLWVTATSEAAAAHAPWLASRLASRHWVDQNTFLVEIASNDGFFLKHYRDAGFRILGVDPSNVALGAAAAGLPSIRAFFGLALAKEIVLEHGCAEVIVARNVLGHSSELRDLLGGIVHLLSPTGRLVIEHPYAYFMREEVQYDQIFHEHVSYPSVQSVAHLIDQFGLKLIDVEFVNMNGGSFLLEAARKEDSAPEAGLEIRRFEKYIQLNDASGWDNFRAAVLHQRDSLVELLHRLKQQKALVVGYGAAAKCMTMLNFCGIGTELITAFGDANPKKQGLLCPGVRIPVLSPQELVALNPQYILLGAWNLKTEIIRQFREDWNYQGKFICPVPVAAIL